MLGLLASLGTAFSQSTSILGTKFATKTIPDEKLITALLWSIGAVLLTVVTLIWYPSLLQNPLEFLNSHTTPDFWWLLPLDGLLNAVATLLMVRALKYSAASLVAPIALLTPALLLITSPIMLGEAVPFVGIVGVLLIVSGAYFLDRQGAKGQNLFAPFLALGRDKGVQSMFGTAVIWSITSNLEKIGIRSSELLLWTASVSIVIALYSVTFWLIWRDRNSQNYQTWRAAIPGTANALTVLLQMYSITVIAVPYVIAIKRTSAIWTILASKVLFGEKIGSRVLGASIMLAGVVLIAFAQ